MINRIEKGILVIFFVDTVHRLIYHQLCKIQRALCPERYLFQIKVNARNIKETTLAMHFIKVTARPSFTRLRDNK